MLGKRWQNVFKTSCVYWVVTMSKKLPVKVMIGPFNIMTVSISFSVQQQMSHYLPQKILRPNKFPLSPPKKVANPVKRFSMHGLEVYSFFSVKNANPVFPLCCESFV